VGENALLRGFDYLAALLLLMEKSSQFNKIQGFRFPSSALNMYSLIGKDPEN